jgi:hypothetical protein
VDSGCSTWTSPRGVAGLGSGGEGETVNQNKLRRWSTSPVPASTSMSYHSTPFLCSRMRQAARDPPSKG